MSLRASALTAAVAAGIGMFGIAAASAAPANGVAIDQAAAPSQNVLQVHYYGHHWHYRHYYRHHHWYWRRYW